MGCHQSCIAPIYQISDVRESTAPNNQKKEATRPEIESNQTASTSSTTVTLGRVESYHSEPIWKRDKVKNISPLGVSVHWLKRGFLKEVKEAGFCNSTNICEIEALIRKKGAGLTYLDNEKDKTHVEHLFGEDNVGPAKIMLSYALENTLVEIVETLEDYCLSNQLDTKCTYVWLSSLCQVKKDSIEDLQDTFDHLRCIGHTFSLMSPWDKPAYFSHARCISELYEANETDNCKLTIVIPPLEKEKMIRSLDKVDKLYEALDSAKIPSKNDLQDQNENSLVEQGPGVKKINYSVNQLLRQWVQGEIMEAIHYYEERVSISLKSRTGCGIKEVFQSSQVGDSSNSSVEDFANLCSQVGSIMAKNGDNDGAINLYRKTLEFDKKVLREYHPDTAATMNNLGAMLEVKGDYDNALTYYRMALKIDLHLFGDFHPDTANTRQNIAAVFCDKGCYQEALKEYYRVLHIRERVLGKDNAEILIARNNIGSALYLKGDFNEALVEFRMAFALCEELFGKDHTYSKSLVEKIHHIRDLLKSNCAWQISFTDDQSSFSTLTDDLNSAQSKGIR